MTWGKMLQVLILLLCAAPWTHGFGDVPLITSEAEMLEFGKQIMQEWKDIERTAIFSEIPDEPRDPLTGVQIFLTTYTGRDGLEHVLQRGEAELEYPPEIFYHEVALKLEEIPVWSDLFNASRFLKNYKNETIMAYIRIKPETNNLIEVPLLDGVAVAQVERKKVNGYPSFTYVFASIETPNAPRDPDPKVQRVNVRFCALESYRLSRKRTMVRWSTSFDLKFDGIPEELVKIYERANIISFMDDLLNHVDEACVKKPLLCPGVKPKRRRGKGKGKA